MSGALRGALLALACVFSVSLTACSSSPFGTCAVGGAQLLGLSVVSHGAVEPSVQACVGEKCSPVPTAGPIPKTQVRRDQQEAVWVSHDKRGVWSIQPGSPLPSSVTIRLYLNGRRISSTNVRVTWPHFDPCAASNPPGPRATVSAPATP